jgi:hypothetical protein
MNSVTGCARPLAHRRGEAAGAPTESWGRRERGRRYPGPPRGGPRTPSPPSARMRRPTTQLREEIENGSGWRESARMARPARRPPASSGWCRSPKRRPRRIPEDTVRSIEEAPARVWVGSMPDAPVAAPRPPIKLAAKDDRADQTASPSCAESCRSRLGRCRPTTAPSSPSTSCLPSSSRASAVGRSTTETGWLGGVTQFCRLALDGEESQRMQQPDQDPRWVKLAFSDGKPRRTRVGMMVVVK